MPRLIKFLERTVRAVLFVPALAAYIVVYGVSFVCFIAKMAWDHGKEDAS